MSIFSSIISEAKKELASVGLYDPGKLTATELKSAKEKNVVISKTLTPITNKLLDAGSVAAVSAGGISGFLIGGPTGAVAGTGGGGVVAAFLQGEKYAPEVTNTLVSTAYKGTTKVLKEAYENPGEAAVVFGLGIPALIFGASKASNVISSYSGNKAAQLSQDDLKSSLDNYTEVIKKNSNTVTNEYIDALANMQKQMEEQNKQNQKLQEKQLKAWNNYLESSTKTQQSQVSSVVPTSTSTVVASTTSKPKSATKKKATKKKATKKKKTTKKKATKKKKSINTRKSKK